MMNGKRFIRTLTVKNLLSYGHEGMHVELLPLNVLIRPNASGKSNLIEILSLLQATPGNSVSPIRAGGGISDWLWKGGSDDTPIAEIDVTLEYPEGIMPLRYRLQLTQIGQRTEMVDEVVENEEPVGNNPNVSFFYRYQQGNPVLNVRTSIEAQAGSDQSRNERRLKREDFKTSRSVLSQFKGSDQYPELTYLGSQFAAIRFYREWNLGRNTEPRKPQPPDLPDDFLTEDARNLGLVLNDLQHRPVTKQFLLEQFEQFYPGAEDITTRIRGGTV